MSEEDDEEDLFFPSHTEEADEGDEGVLSVSPILITSQISAPGNERPVDLTASPPPSGDTPVVDLDASPSGGSPVAEVSTTSSPRNLSPREPSNSVAHRGALTLENSHGADETSAPEEGEAQISGRPSSLTEESHPVLPENIPINEAASTSVPEEEVQILDNFSAVEEPSVPANEAVEPSEEPSAVRESVTPTGIKRKACSDEGNSTKKAKNETEEEDDDNDEGSYCTICFESWTNSGDHRISSLKCGHFFGFVCLDRWLKTGKSCPNCNEKATRKDIRSHYVAKLKAIDTSEQERVKSDLNRLKTEYRKLELDYTSLKVANKMQIEEIERLQKEVAKLYKGAEAPPLLTSSGESSINKPTDTNQSSAGVFKWVYQKRIELVKESAIRGGKLGCRIMTYDANQAMLVVTQPSYTLLAPGFGVRRINMLDLNSNTHSFVGLHKEQIRDLEFNPSNHDQLLSVSQDKSVKLTNISSCSDIQRYHCESEIWSCAWNADNPYEFFVGTKRSQIFLYDVRSSSDTGYKQQIEFPVVERRPIINLYYVPECQESDNFRPGGLIVQTLGSLWFFRKENVETYKPFKLPVEGLFWNLRFEPISRMIYVTTKPSPHARHIVACLTEIQISQDPPSTAVSATIVMDHSRGGTYSEKSFLRSVLYPWRANAFVAYSRGSGNTDHKVMVQEVGSDRVVQEIGVRKPVLDMCVCSVNNIVYLVLLSETEIFIYILTEC